MNNINSDDIKSLSTLTSNTLDSTVDKMLSTNNSDTLKDLISEFNANQAKKNAVRILKYNDLLDKLSQEIEQRFENNSEEFTNNDLMTFLQSIQALIDKSNKYVNNIPESTINFNQINITNEVKETNVNSESRRKIRFIIEQILKDNTEEEIIIEGDKDEEESRNTDNEQSSDSD